MTYFPLMLINTFIITIHCMSCGVWMCVCGRTIGESGVDVKAGLIDGRGSLGLL